MAPIDNFWIIGPKEYLDSTKAENYHNRVINSKKEKKTADLIF
jgi:hypothetical protein